MTCIKKFLYSVAFVFLFSVFTVFGISPNTSALSSSLTGSLDSTSYLCSNTSECSPYTSGFYFNFSISPSPSLGSTDFYVNSSLSLRLVVTSSGTSFVFPMPFFSESTTFYFPPLSSISRISANFSNKGDNSARNFTINFSSDSPSGGITPEGSLTITENGTFDVTSYAQAVVDVPIVPGDYHDDLISINNSIIICAGVALVIYFFYAIYRMMFKGVKS